MSLVEEELNWKERSSWYTVEVELMCFGSGHTVPALTGSDETL